MDTLLLIGAPVVSTLGNLLLVSVCPSRLRTVCARLIKRVIARTAVLASLSQQSTCAAAQPLSTSTVVIMSALTALIRAVGADDPVSALAASQITFFTAHVPAYVRHLSSIAVPNASA